MANSLDELPLRAALVEVARDFHARGWMPGTAGNLSARADDDHFWVTASGRPKGRLDESDFLLVRIVDGEVVEQARPGNNPSAETAIHRTLYALFPDARACLHGHSVPACLVATRAKPKAKSLRLPSLEMIKGFGIWQQKPKVNLALFENRLDVSRLAREIDNRFRRTSPAVTALLVRDHGATVWGDSLQQTYDRFEVLDYILSYCAHARAR
jgi:methylthioribulose-1-phosphate dehydratase